MAEKGRWVTPDGKEHKGIFYGVDVRTGNKHVDIPSLPKGVLSGGHWESDGEVETVPEIKYGKGG